MTAETIVGIIATALTFVGGLAWWAIQRAVKIGEWKADREHSERLAKNHTRESINRIEPKIDGLVALAQRHSEIMAVIDHQTKDHGKRLDAAENRLDEHGNRISVLEADKGVRR